MHSCHSAKPVHDLSTLTPSLLGLEALAVNATSIRVMWHGSQTSSHLKYRIQLRPYRGGEVGADVRTTVT